MVFKQVKEEWRTSATRHKVGIVVLAIVVLAVMLFAPSEQRTAMLVRAVSCCDWSKGFYFMHAF